MSQQSQIVMAVRCNWCSHHKPPTRIMRLSTGQHMCDYCYEHHLHASDVLVDSEVLKGCVLCGLTFAQMRDLEIGPTFRMYVIPIDGIYALACRHCKDEYTRKRADIFKGTQYGEEMKIV